MICKHKFLKILCIRDIQKIIEETYCNIYFIHDNVVFIAFYLTSTYTGKDLCSYCFLSDPYIR